MGFPFKKIDGKPIDLSKKEHRDIAIKRQKTLDNAIENGLRISEVKINAKIEVEFQCVKCGTGIDTYIIHEYNIDILDFELNNELSCKTVKCRCCDTKYTYHSFEEVFYVRPVDLPNQL